MFSEAPTSATPQIRQNHCFFAGKLPYFRSFGVGGPWAAPSPAGGPSRLTPDFPTNQFSDFLFLGPCNVLPNPPQNNHFHSFTMASHATFCQPPLRTTISTASLWLLMQLYAEPPLSIPYFAFVLTLILSECRLTCFFGRNPNCFRTMDRTEASSSSGFSERADGIEGNIDSGSLGGDV